MANAITTGESAQSTLVTLTDGIPTTTTRDIAEAFGKNHDDVLRTVRGRMAESGEWGISMNELVIKTKDEPVTTTLAISEGTKVSHKAVIQLVRTYQKDLEEFGLLAFEMRPRLLGKHGGGDVEYAIINEPQSTLLLTYMRNTDIVRAFKKRLVKEFMAMRKALIQQSIQKQDAYWQQKRVEGKTVRLAWGGSVQEFVEYAKSQGSQNAPEYYRAITKMEYAALELVKQASDKQFRDTLDAIQHSQLTVIEMAAQETLRKGMAQNMHYKDIFKQTKEACVQLAESLRKYLPSPKPPKAIETASLNFEGATA